MSDFTKASVKREQFMGIDIPETLVTFTVTTVGIMQAATLYKTPATPDVAYADLITYAGNVTLSKNTWVTSLTPENHVLMVGQMNFLKSKWGLEADWIEKISNDPANATSTETAAANIASAGLVFNKITSSPAGIPIQPVVELSNPTSGEVKARTTNTEYSAAMTTYVAVETDAHATVTVVDGQATVEIPVVIVANQSSPLQSSVTTTVSYPAEKVITKTVKGKGAIYTVIKQFTKKTEYTVYAFGINSKGKSGPLSKPETFVCT